jgi:uncharacterized protein (TIGR00369 family)
MSEQPRLLRLTLNDLRLRGTDRLPGLIGVEMVSLEWGLVHSRLTVRPQLLAPNGFLHAASVIALADTTCGYGCVAHLPEGAERFTTIELKSNFVGTCRDGGIRCEARPAHLGRMTQLWDAEVFDERDDRRIALFRCTQMVLWPQAQ